MAIFQIGNRCGVVTNMPSTKTKYPAASVMPIANVIIRELAPFCERIEIAGSLRRRKAEVSDIEVIFVPRISQRPDGLFGTKSYSMADEKIEQMVSGGIIAKRRKSDESFTWGEKNKLAVHIASGIPIDFFATSSENWWVSLVIRTGSKENNLKLTNGAIRRGGSLNAYGCGVTWNDGSVTAAKSEREVFELCGVDYVEPNMR